MIERQGIAPQYDVQALRPEARSVLREFVKPAMHRCIIRLRGHIADHRAVDGQRPGRASFTEPVGGLAPRHDEPALT